MPSNRDIMTVNVNGSRELRTALSRLTNPQALIRPLLVVAGYAMHEHIRETFDRQRDPVTGAPWQPVTQFGDDPDPSKKILQHNARLIQGIMAAKPEISDNEVSVGPPDDIAYANIHQYGGIVRPRRSKNLALPLTKEARRAVTARRWVEQQGGRHFVYRARTGKRNLFLATRADNGAVQLHWLLKKSVTIPQRRYIGWGTEQIDDIQSRMLKRVARAAREQGLDAT